MKCWTKSSLYKQVLATLTYYHALGKMAMTPLEVYRYLLNPPHVRSTKYEVRSTRLGEIIDQLDKLTARGIVRRQWGYYFLPQNKDAAVKRIQKRKNAIEKRRILQRITPLIAKMPYVRAVALNGSLALDNTNKNSDIDLFILTAPHRIWSARFLVSAVTHLLGIRRHGQYITNRICLNHYAAQHNLQMPVQNFAITPIFTQLIPVSGRKEIKALFSRNAWVKNFAPTFPAPPNIPKHPNTPKHPNILERFFRTIQLKKINLQIQGRKLQPTEFIVNNALLLFHYPASRTQNAYQNFVTLWMSQKCHKNVTKFIHNLSP